MLTPINQIRYPMLSEVLVASDMDLAEVSKAIKALIRITYGERHWALTPKDRLHRATLKKLANLVDQIALLDDLDLYEMGFNCPQQLRRYHSSLQASVPIAYQLGMSKADLRTLDDAHERLWQVMQEVTFIFNGLS